MSREFACDAIIIKDGKIALVKRGREPFKGEWALPGGRIEQEESAEECLVREAKEETSLEVKSIRLTGIYSDPKRDPRGVIAAAYLCECVSGEIMGGDDASEAAWFNLDKLPKLCTDHKKILEDALIYYK